MVPAQSGFPPDFLGFLPNFLDFFLHFVLIFFPIFHFHSDFLDFLGWRWW